MRTFVGIIPPPEFAARVVSFAQSQPGLRSSRVEPHITILPPADISDPEPLIASAREVAKTVEPITVLLNQPKIYSNALTLTAESADLFTLHAKLTPAEGRFNPHLTLGRITDRGINKTHWYSLVQSTFSLPEEVIFTTLVVFGFEEMKREYDRLATLDLS